MIKIFSDSPTFDNFEEFESIDEALEYIGNNTGLFSNMERIVLIDFDNCISFFYRAELTMKINPIR